GLEIREHGRAETGVQRFLARSEERLFVLRDVVVLQHPVLRRHAEVRRALKDRQLLRLRGDDRNRLDARRTRADDADALAGEVDAGVRPAPRVIRLPLEALDAGEVRHARGGETACSRDQVARATTTLRLGVDEPAVARFLELR